MTFNVRKITFDGKQNQTPTRHDEESLLRIMDSAGLSLNDFKTLAKQLSQAGSSTLPSVDPASVAHLVHVLNRGVSGWEVFSQIPAFKKKWAEDSQLYLQQGKEMLANLVRYRNADLSGFQASVAAFPKTMLTNITPEVLTSWQNRVFVTRVMGERRDDDEAIMQTLSSVLSMSAPALAVERTYKFKKFTEIKF